MDDAMGRVRERIGSELNRVSRWVVLLRREARAQEWEAGGDNTPLSEPEDVAQVIEERETETQLLDWLVRRSVELRLALQRIDKGTYGVCECCEEFIHPERLLALPEASMCLGCQTEREKHHPVHAMPLARQAGSALS